MLLEKIRSTLVNRAPDLIKVSCAFTPNLIQEKIMLKGLERVFQEALADGDLDFLDGRWLEVHVRDIEFKSYISLKANSLITKSELAENEQADVRFSGNLNDLILVAARKEDPDTLFFQRRLLIEGDTELGLEVKNLMDSIELDALPSVMKHSLFSLADFVQKGLQPLPEMTGGVYAHKG